MDRRTQDQPHVIVYSVQRNKILQLQGLPIKNPWIFKFSQVLKRNSNPGDNASNTGFILIQHLIRNPLISLYCHRFIVEKVYPKDIVDMGQMIPRGAAEWIVCCLVAIKCFVLSNIFKSVPNRCATGDRAPLPI